MIPITIRLEPERYAKIEELRGNIPRADFLRDIIDTFIQQSDSPSISKDAPEYLREIEQLKNQLQHSDTRISDLLNQIDTQKNQAKTLEQQLGFLQLEYQKMSNRLMLPAAKSWWQFWKK